MSDELFLSELVGGLPGVTNALGVTHKEACLVCFDDQGHRSSVSLLVDGIVKREVKIHWEENVTQQMRDAWNDAEVTTEHAAYGIAFLLIIRVTNYTVIRKSRKGTGFDYWLGYQDDRLPFTDAARLEVSGLRCEPIGEVRKRLNKKINQTKKSDSLLIPAYVVIVEFGTPLSYVVKR